MLSYTLDSVGNPSPFTLHPSPNHKMVKYKYTVCTTRALTIYVWLYFRIIQEH